jgi:hypothetical protein
MDLTMMESWWQIGKNGRILFDRPKPTVGCSASGRRRIRRRRRRRIFVWVSVLFNGVVRCEDHVVREGVSECIWSIGGMTLTGWTSSTGRKTCPTVSHFVQHKRFMDWPVIEPGCWSKRPATGCLNRGTHGAIFPFHLWDDTDVVVIRVPPALFRNETCAIFACSLSSNAESSVFHVVWSTKVFQTGTCIQNVIHVRCNSESCS